MDDRLIHLAAKLATAYAAKNTLKADELADLIRSTYATLAQTAAPEQPVAEPPQPAVSLKKSVSAEAILCLECGKPNKMLKRHLQTAHGLTVDEYRAKWGLPADYPMVAPNYAAHRSELAIKIGLGRKPVAAKPTEAAPAGTKDEKPRHRYPASRWSRPTD